MSNNIIDKVKPVEVGCVVWVDGYKSKVTKITDDGVVGLVLDDGLITEFYYECLLGDIHYDDFADDLYIETERVPLVGDVIGINEKEYRLVAIDDGVVTLERGDEIRYYSFYDITWDIMDGYWISSINEQVFSPTVRRKLKVYEVEDTVYLYNSLEELKEIYELLGKPPIQGFYGTDSYENLTDSLQHKHGLIYYWEDYDSDWGWTYKYMKVIQGAYIKE